MKVGSLFSGIGGLDLGLERAGMEIRWQVEYDEFCRRVLAKHWPDVPCYGDVRELNATELEPVDLICGGFPCQPVSRAGLRRAQDDTRWLWPEFARIICALRPAFVLMENVPGLLDRGFSDVLGDLAESGYDAEWQCIPAAAVGAPHIRDRVWLLAYARPEHGGFAGRIDARSGRDNVLPQGDHWDPTQWREDRQLIALVPGVHPGVAEDWWRSQSRMARSVNGLPDVMDRCCALGNAVVPQVAEFIGRRLMEVGK